MVAVPQIRESLEAFESLWLRAIGKRSKRLLELVPMLYVKGMSQRDIEGALIETLGVEGTGRSVINEVCRSLRGDFERWQDRSYKEGMARAGTIIADYKESFPAAMKCLEQDLEESLTALKFPLVHRIRIRTTNLLERLFGEARRRTKIIPRFTSDASGLSLVFAVLIDASEGWRGVRMKPYLEKRLRQIATDPDSTWEDPDLARLTA